MWHLGEGGHEPERVKRHYILAAAHRQLGIAADRPIQPEARRPGYQVPRHLAGERDLAACQSHIALHLAARLQIHAVAGRQHIAANHGGGAKHQRRPGDPHIVQHPATHRNALPCCPQVAFNNSRRRDRDHGCKDDQVALHRALQGKGVRRHVQVIVDHLSIIYDHLLSRQRRVCLYWGSQAEEKQDQQ